MQGSAKVRAIVRQGSAKTCSEAPEIVQQTALGEGQIRPVWVFKIGGEAFMVGSVWPTDNLRLKPIFGDNVFHEISQVLESLKGRGVPTLGKQDAISGQTDHAPPFRNG
ncbi:MAG: hypothetical protein ACR2PW_04715 [Gammaproteobacteria bacterium]